MRSMLRATNSNCAAVLIVAGVAAYFVGTAVEHGARSRDVAAAKAQLQNGHAGCDFVTLSGDLLSRHGIYTGGTLNAGGDGQLFQRHQVGGGSAKFVIYLDADHRAAAMRADAAAAGPEQQARLDSSASQIVMAREQLARSADQISAVLAARPQGAT